MCSVETVSTLGAGGPAEGRPSESCSKDSGSSVTMLGISRGSRVYLSENGALPVVADLVGRGLTSSFSTMVWIR